LYNTLKHILARGDKHPKPRLIKNDYYDSRKEFVEADPDVKSQLNGSNGEVTNKDDVKGSKTKNSNIRKRLGQIQNLEERVLHLTKGNGSKKKKNVPKKKTQPTASRQTPIDSSLKHQIMAQIAPHLVPRCTAAGLHQPKPSQKISARGLATISIPANASMVLALAPNGASNTSSVSVFGFVAPTATMATSGNLVLGVTSPAQGAGVYPTDATSGVTISTNTPYSANNITNNSYNLKFVSASLKFTNTTSQLNRGGELLFLMDEDQQMSSIYINNTNVLATGLNCNNVLTQMTASSRTVRIPFVSDARIIVHGSDHIAPPSNTFAGASKAGGISGTWTSMGDVTGYSTANAQWQNQVFGNTGISTNTSSGNPIGYIYYANTTGASQSITIEEIEHWEFHGQQIEMLHTPSPSHPIISGAITNLVGAAKSEHAFRPHHSFAEVCADVVKSPTFKSTMHGISDMITPIVKEAASKKGETMLGAFAAMMLA
jgi:hypothetical protein